MKQLYFVRHGLSVLGQQGLWAGSTDTPLADEGRTQASQAGVTARAQGLRFDVIISSPLIRAAETARLIAVELDYPISAIETSSLIVERDFGDLESMPWHSEYDVDAVPSAESREALLARAQTFLDELRARPEDTILIVSHGSFGRALRSLISPDIPFNTKHRFENAVITELL